MDSRIAFVAFSFFLLVSESLNVSADTLREQSPGYRNVRSVTREDLLLSDQPEKSDTGMTSDNELINDGEEADKPELDDYYYRPMMSSIDEDRPVS